MKELLLGQRSFSQSWLLFLAIGVMLSQSSSWVALSLPPMWLFASALPLFLRTARVTKYEEMLASGQASQVEARSYRLYLGKIFQAAGMTCLLFLVHRCLHTEAPSWRDLQFTWLYLPISLFLHPLPIRKKITFWLWACSYGAFLWRDGAQMLPFLLGLAATISLCERIKSPYKAKLARRLSFAPTASSDNP